MTTTLLDVGETGIDERNVTAWLVDNIAGAVAPFEFAIIAGGRSNLTFAVTDAADNRFVLRRPPTGAVLATAHDMAREHRIISAVGLTDVPVPPALGLCTDETVTGAPFYVMGFVDGVVLDSSEQAAGMSVEVRRAAGEHLIDVLADLHAVDIDEVGLGDLARRDGYVERQVKRWTTQWEKSKTRELPAIDEVAVRLAQRIPTQVGVSIAHGDYRFGNCLVDTTTGRVNAVLDWELGTLGDPLADVGYLGVYWADPGDEQHRPNDPTGIEGFPTYADLLDRYAARTGRDLSDIDYYRAFSAWRLAVISEGVYARFLHGAMGDQQADPAMLDAFKTGAVRLAEDALDAMRRLT
ncbi:MAG: phosphotransferase family protein [Ilumatobacter sp.]|nr:phosphotransferase family protein [Ilumatobacter sp.]